MIPVTVNSHIRLHFNSFVMFITKNMSPNRKEGRKEGTCLFDINIKHNTEIFIGKIISGDSH